MYHSIEHSFNTPICELNPLSSPDNLTAQNFGATGSTTRIFYISAINAIGETLTSSVVSTSGNSTLSSSNFIRLRWDKVYGATGYKIYVADGYIGQTTDLYFDVTTNSYTLQTLPQQNTTGYNPLYNSCGNLLKSQNNGIGPIPTVVARPMEQSTSIPAGFIANIAWSPDIDWVFYTDAAIAAPNRRIGMYTFNRNTFQFTWAGFITLTFPIGTNKTIRGFWPEYQVYSRGQVSVSGTAVTGSGTLWQTDRLCAESRIGFGSYDPTLITTWYTISSINSDTSITLTGSAGVIAANTPYVIEDLRMIVSVTAATATNGGLFLAKGVSFSDFTAGGTAIPAANTTDNIKAVYWLADAGVVTNTTSCGVAIDEMENWQTQYVYIINGTTNPSCYRYNFRAPLTSLVSGRTTSAFNFSTGTQAVTGTVSQVNNGEVILTQKGHTSGQKSLYFVTTTRVCRADISQITPGNTLWIDNIMVEIPPGSGNTFQLSNSLHYIEYMDYLDEFVIWSSGSNRSYITDFQASQEQFVSIFNIESKQNDRSSASANLVPHPSSNSAGLVSWNDEGLSFLVRQSTTIDQNQIYSTTYSACYTHLWVSGREQSLITPAIPTPQNMVVKRIYIQKPLQIGADDFLAIPPELIKIFVRLDGIFTNDDNWIPVPDSGTVDGLLTGEYIQFKIHFKVIGSYSVPNYVTRIGALLEEKPAEIPLDNSEFIRWNLNDTDLNQGIIGFIDTRGGGNTLQIIFTRKDTGEILFVQSSGATTYGVFESWNGSAWVTGTGSAPSDQRLRFRSTNSLLTGTNVAVYVRAL